MCRLTKTCVQIGGDVLVGEGSGVWMRGDAEWEMGEESRWQR